MAITAVAVVMCITHNSGPWVLPIKWPEGKRCQIALLYTLQGASCVAEPFTSVLQCSLPLNVCSSSFISQGRERARNARQLSVTLFIYVISSVYATMTDFHACAGWGKRSVVAFLRSPGIFFLLLFCLQLRSLLVLPLLAFLTLVLFFFFNWSWLNVNWR